VPLSILTLSRQRQTVSMCERKEKMRKVAVRGTTFKAARG